MSDEIKAYNQRQYKLMLAKLNLYKNYKVSLNHLIINLEALLNVLNEIDEYWKNEFVKQWQDLEIIYSCYKYPKYEELNETDKEYVNKGKDKIEIKKAVNKLIKLVKSKIIKEE